MGCLVCVPCALNSFIHNIFVDCYAPVYMKYNHFEFKFEYVSNSFHSPKKNHKSIWRPAAICALVKASHVHATEPATCTFDHFLDMEWTNAGGQFLDNMGKTHTTRSRKRTTCTCDEILDVKLTECKGSICGLLAKQSARGVTECTCGRPRVRGLAECTGSNLGKTATEKIFYLQKETTRGTLGYRM